jgi:uncharacterized protein (TIGR02284 family)
MTYNEKLIEELNDLVEIQNDRIRGYEKAMEAVEQKDIDLKALFESFKQNSIQHREELSKEITTLGGSVEDGTTVSGKIYRAWMDIKATFTGHSRESALESCVFGEEAAQKAYDMALASDAEMSAEVRQIITSQLASLKSDYKKIKGVTKINSVLNA